MIEINGVKLYDSSELATMLNVSRVTIGRLRKRGKLKFTRVGKKLYSSDQALNDYLNGIVRDTLK